MTPDEGLARAGVKTAVRAGRMRLSCHLYNAEGDIDLALEAFTSADRDAFAAR